MPVTPYIVNGTVTNESSSVVSGVIVTGHNTTTGERTTATTNSLGQYVLDLANLTSGWTLGDSITVYVRNDGYAGETSFTLSGVGATENISVSNQVTLASLKNTLWYAVYKTLQTGTFAITTDNIYSAMNDKIVADVGYPLVIIYPITNDRTGMNMVNSQVESNVNLMIEVYHTSSENCKILADNVENQIWRAQEVWSGIGLYGLKMSDSNYDWYTDASKKIHRITLNANFKFDGVVDIP